MLFDPFEKQFDLPSASIKVRDSYCRQRNLICQQLQPLFFFRIEKQKGLAIKYFHENYLEFETEENSDLVQTVFMVAEKIASG
jgi:hypothetical protein